jgi:hypothetical protein
MHLPVDQDILKMKIQKDLENKYRFELDSKTVEIDKLSESYFEVKRLHELSKNTIDSLKIEADKTLSDVKKRYGEEISELVADNHAL